MVRIVATGAVPHLADRIAEELSSEPADHAVGRFPDGEADVELTQRVRGEDVYLVGSTGPPVDARLVELALLADACRRADAGRVTAVIPYFGYARQDRRSGSGQAVPTRMVADTLQSAGVERVVVVDPHTPSLEATFDVPVESVTAVPQLVDAAQDALPDDTIVVAPDLGGVKLAERVAVALDLPTAVVRKSRLSGTAVETSGLVGDIGDRVPLLVDDMISTGGTLEAATQALQEAGGKAEVHIAAVHGLFAGDALERVGRLPVRQLVVTDSLPIEGSLPVPHRVESLAPRLADAIGRLHRGEGLGELAAHG